MKFHYAELAVGNSLKNLYDDLLMVSIGAHRDTPLLINL